MNTIKLASEQIEPSKIVCIGRNYLEHIQELGNEVADSMVIFIKPNSSISNTLRSTIDEPIHFEGEICFMVKRGILHAVGFGLDLTKRDLQSRLKGKGLPWERAKAFDGAACFSEFIPLGNTPVESLSLQLDINEKVAQSGDYPLMIYKPQDILQEVSSFMTLNDGDIIMTGTPKGVGVIKPKDHFKGKIRSADKTLVSQAWMAE
jgi:2-keto-4-pentenoate hydratase/2-oxohepta-3-ene-1,7-dioic acid hydratase in catechol pathway